MCRLGVHPFQLAAGDPPAVLVPSWRPTFSAGGFDASVALSRRLGVPPFQLVALTLLWPSRAALVSIPSSWWPLTLLWPPRAALVSIPLPAGGSNSQAAPCAGLVPVSLDWLFRRL